MKPNYTKTLLCFANSRKPSGRCIAGKEVGQERLGSWVRPVSSRPAGELSETDRWFSNGKDPKLLDVISVPCIAPHPHAYQTENHLIDDRFYWTLVRKATWDEVENSIDSVSGPLWSNGASGRYGQNDKILDESTRFLESSLKLIKVPNVRITVEVEWPDYDGGKRKVRGSFTLNGIDYTLSITDPIIERLYYDGSDGTFDFGPAALCLSIGEIYEGYAYKLIAGVIKPF